MLGLPSVVRDTSTLPAGTETLLATGQGQFSTVTLRHRTAGAYSNGSTCRDWQECWGVITINRDGTRGGRWIKTSEGGEAECRRLFDLWTTEGR